MLTETQKKEVKKLMAKGMSMAQAYDKLGLATKVTKVDCATEKPKKRATTPRERKIDPVKAWVINFISIPLKGCKKGVVDYEITDIVTDGAKTIDFMIDGESYTLTLTKHKKKA